MNIMIVEDDRITLDGIIHIVNWDELGIERIERAEDGIEALELSAGFRPDIVLLDINMPRLDGIGFATRLREICPDCAIVFMSAYSRREYYRDAIKLKAVRFVEKPIDVEELTGALADAVSVCAENRRREQSVYDANQALDLSLPLIRRELSSLLISKEASYEKIGKMSLFLPDATYPEGAMFTVILLRTHAGPTDAEAIAAMQDALERALAQRGFRSFAAPHDEYSWTVHVNASAREPEKFSDEGLRALCAAVLETLPEGRGASAAAGAPVREVERIHASYEAALAAQQRLFLTGERIGLYAASDEEGNPYVFDAKLVDAFRLALRGRDAAGVGQLLREVSEGLRRHPDTPVLRARHFYFRLLMQLAQFAQEENLLPPDEQTGGDSLWETIHSFAFLRDLETWTREQALDYLRLAGDNSRSDAIERVLSYIHEHYHERALSTAGISKKVFLSPAYMCVLFKQETGETISRYINRYRIDQACGLLRNPVLKIADVAGAVGYGDADYFARVFRRLIGATPSEYREKAGSS